MLLMPCSCAVLLVKLSATYSRLRKVPESSSCTPSMISIEKVLLEALARLSLQERWEGSTVRQQ